MNKLWAGMIAAILLAGPVAMSDSAAAAKRYHYTKHHRHHWVHHRHHGWIGHHRHHRGFIRVRFGRGHHCW